MIKTSKKLIWGYGFGNFGFGLIFQLMATYFVFYATAVLGLSGALVGSIVAVGVIWDALSDPIMGYISDNTHNAKHGRRHLYLWIGGILVVLSNLMIWNMHLGIPKWLEVPSLIILLVVVKTGMTIYGTPYTALGAELTENQGIRLKIQSVKTIFFLLGISFAAAGCMLLFFSPTEAYPVGQLNPHSYKYMSLVTSLLMFISMWIAIQYTKKAIPDLPQNENKESGLKDFFISMKEAYAHSDLRAIVLGYLFTNIASAILSTIGLHVYTYTFNMDNTKIALIAGAQLSVAILSQPFWIWLNGKVDKLKGIKIGLSLSIISFVYFVFCVINMAFTAEHLWVLLPFMILGGIGSGGLLTLPQAMVADSADANTLNTGNRREGVYYGTMTLTYKLSQSVAIVLIGYILDLIGFNSKLEVQNTHTLLGLGFVLGIGSILALIFAYLSYRPYGLTRKRMDDIHLKLHGEKI